MAMLDFRLQSFLAVCEVQSFTHAAELLHITQPAVSQHIRYLEETYGTKLFYYEGKKPRLTAAGTLLQQKATAVRNDEILLQERFALGVEQGVPLRFGVTMTIGEFIIAKPLARYLRQYPANGVCMEMGNTSELLSRLRHGALHFALVEGYFNRDEFDSLAYSTEQFIAVCAAHHRFAHEPAVLQDLCGEQILAREPGSGTRDILEKHLAAQNLSLKDFAGMIQIGSMPAILQLLQEDIGISFLYRRAAEQLLQAGVLRTLSLANFQVTHDFAFIWERGSVNADEYRALCRKLQTLAE